MFWTKLIILNLSPTIAGDSFSHAVSCDSIFTLNNKEYYETKLTKIYPNPSNETVIIEAPQQSTIEITNIQGRLIETLATTGNKTTIDVSALARGMYFVKIKTERGVAVKKFIKE